METMEEILLKLKKKLISIAVIIATLCIVGWICFSAGKQEAAQPDTEVSSETDAETTRWLELHFGNGEIYKQQITGTYSSRLALQSFKIADEYYYFIEDAYKMDYNKETNTYALYLWRDEPYQLEKELFEKVN